MGGQCVKMACDYPLKMCYEVPVLRVQINPEVAIAHHNKVGVALPVLSSVCSDEAWGVGKLRHKRVANLIGYCCDGDERLLVAEYMPNDTLAKHLFHWKINKSIGNRLRVALCIAEALDYCSTEGRPLYHDLNAYRVLFDEGELHQKVLVSASGLFFWIFSAENRIPRVNALEMIRGKNINLLMDSHLEGNFSTEEATVVFDLASRCLQYEPKGTTKYQRSRLNTCSIAEQTRCQSLRSLLHFTNCMHI
ncbi:probable serine/threonine-protein kinase [Tanacetum coccineum]